MRCEQLKNISEKLQLGMYTEEPLFRWLKDFCRTAAPYLPPWAQHPPPPLSVAQVQNIIKDLRPKKYSK